MIKTARANQKAQLLFCFAVCVLLLLPLFLVGIYDRPSADDYDYAIRTHEAVLRNEGFWGVLKAAFETDLNFYNTWQGLYSSAFILALQPAIWGERFYALTPVLVICCAYFFTFMAVHLINKLCLKKSMLFSATASLVLLTFILLFLPSPVEGLYWYNGAMNYMPWAFSNVFNICLLVWIRDGFARPKNMIYLAVSVVLSFLTSGGNHVTAFANILALAILSAYFLLKKRFYPLLPLAAAVAGFVIMYKAPGTAVRASQLNQQTIVRTVMEVVKYVRATADDWISVQWLISIIAITPVSILIAHQTKNKIPKWFPFASLILSVGIICGMLCVPFYAMGSFGALRVTNVVWITFMFLSWFDYTLFVILFSQSGAINTENILYGKHSSLVATCVVCVSLFLAFASIGTYGYSNSYKAALELEKGTARAYCREMDERFARFNDESLTEVQVRPLGVKSELLFFAEIGEDPEVWPGTSISEYYGKPIYLVH